MQEVEEVEGVEGIEGVSIMQRMQGEGLHESSLLKRRAMIKQPTTSN